MPRGLARASVFTTAGALGVSGVGLLTTAFAAPATAADTCTPIGDAPTPTLVATDVCQVIITDSGSYTMPASIAKVSAVVIGAGGGGDFEGNGPSTYAAGGGGGQLVYVDSVGTGTPTIATIGAGGTAATAGAGGAGGSTTFDGATALGGGGGASVGDPTTGIAAALGGASGSGNAAVPGANGGTVGGSSLSGGGGARTASPDNSGAAGAGWSLSAFVAAQSGDATLFPSAADGAASYGDGGAASAVGGVATGTDFGDGGVGQPPAGSAGVAGAVILRYAATSAAPPSSTTNPAPPSSGTNPAPASSSTAPAVPAATDPAPVAGTADAAQTELAATGSTAPFPAVAGGIALTVAGTVVAAFARLRRRGANGTR